MTVTVIEMTLPRSKLRGMFKFNLDEAGYSESARLSYIL
jgi:hypothetical protein